MTKDQVNDQNLVAELQDLRERVRRLEAGWSQAPQCIGYEQTLSPITFSGVGHTGVTTSQCVVTAQYLHYFMVAFTSSYTGGGDVNMRFLIQSTVGSTTVDAVPILGPDLVYYQGSIDLFDEIGGDVRGKEATIELEAGVTIAGGSVELHVNGGFTLRSNPASRYSHLIG